MSGLRTESNPELESVGVDRFGLSRNRSWIGKMVPLRPEMVSPGVKGREGHTGAWAIRGTKWEDSGTSSPGVPGGAGLPRLAKYPLRHLQVSEYFTISPMAPGLPDLDVAPSTPQSQLLTPALKFL